MKRLILPFVILLGCVSAYSVDRDNMILISKKEMNLYVVNSVSDTLFAAPIACGMNLGNKTRKGDHKTPEGKFTILSIENSSGWSHDFHDGKGLRRHAYGPWFFRLKVPGFRSIGIHGTCLPESIGTRSSEGCIRLENNRLLELKQYVFPGMTVIIDKD